MRSQQFAGGRGNGWHGRYGHRGYGFGSGFGVGLATGALVGGAAYGYGYPYYGNGYDDGYAYGDADYDGAYAAAPDAGGDTDQYCAQRYRSYDPSSGTFLGYDGMRHPCP